MKSPLSSLRPSPKQKPHALGAELVELVDGAQHRQAPPGILLAAEPDRFHDAVEHLAVVNPDHVVAARDAQRLHRVGHHHAHLGIRLDAGGAHRIGVELHELAEAAGARLLVAEDVAGAIGAVGQLDSLKFSATWRASGAVRS